MNAVIFNGKSYPALVSMNTEIIEAVGNPLRLKILRELNEQPMYPIEIAKKFGMIEQKIYYHIKILKAAKLIEEVEERQMRGGKAKLL